MSDELLLRANAVKAGVETGKENFAATKREFEVTKRLLNETLAEVKEKYGIESYEELQQSVKDLAIKISGDLEKIEALLEAANISVSSTN
jgi:5-enolpyruvylshikimate-3-phosphate synthase